MACDAALTAACAPDLILSRLSKIIVPTIVDPTLEKKPLLFLVLSSLIKISDSCSLIVFSIFVLSSDVSGAKEIIKIYCFKNILRSNLPAKIQQIKVTIKNNARQFILVNATLKFFLLLERSWFKCT